MSVISMKQLLEAGVHFGHQTRKWNPKMKKYIFTDRNDIHIINLEDTSRQIDKAFLFIKDMVAAGSSVLFVGTKKQASETIMQEAERCGMFYINSRWLGGTLTNFKTIRSRVERLNKLDNMEILGDFELLPKKEVIKLKAERSKLKTNLSGIREMTSMPGLVIMVDPKTEHIAVNECKKLNIPTVGIVDTNCDPDDVTVCIPANDDAIRSLKLILGALADAIIEVKEGVQIRDLNAADEDFSMDTIVQNVNKEEVGKDYSKKEEHKTEKKFFKKETVKTEIVKQEEQKTEKVIATEQEIQPTAPKIAKKKVTE